jgi:hypothetical protein
MAANKMSGPPGRNGADFQSHNHLYHLKGYIEAKLHYDQSKEASLTVEQWIDTGGDFHAAAAARLGFAASALVFGVIFGVASVTQGMPPTGSYWRPLSA